MEFLFNEDKRLQHKCFPVKSAKFSRIPILENTASDYFSKVLFKDIVIIVSDF